MATLLDIGDLPFLAVKVAIGAVAVTVLWRWRTLSLAKYGLTVTLGIYISLMGIHLFTGLSAFGLISANTINKFTAVTHQYFALFV